MLPAVLLLMAAFAAPLWAQAGTLSLGQPVIEGTQYVFPVALSGADAQVSALDFRLQFDPRVFVPVSASAGPAALAANKMVTANNSAPGQFVVVMMGLNQSTIPGGLVASVVFQRTGDGDGAAATTVGIADLTLAGPDGNELPASGSSVSVPLRESTPTDKTEGEEEGDSAPEPAPTTPTSETPAPETPTPGTPTAPARKMLAGAPADNAEGPTPGVALPPTPQAAAQGQPMPTPKVPVAGNAVKPDGIEDAPKQATGAAGMRTPLPLQGNKATTDSNGGETTATPSTSGTASDADTPAAKSSITLGGSASGIAPSDNAVTDITNETGGLPPFVWPLLVLVVLLLLFLATRQLLGRH